MRARFALWLMLMPLLMALPWRAHAQIYVCKDGNGKTLTSDRPIAECASRPMRELGNSGMTRRDIPAPLTPEQKRLMQSEAARQQAEHEILLESRRRDQAILERFRTEQEIDAARQRALTDRAERLRQQTASLQRAEKWLKEVELDARQRQQKDGIPAAYLRKIEEAKTLVQAEQAALQYDKLEQHKVEAGYDHTLKRFRELTAGQPHP